MLLHASKPLIITTNDCLYFSQQACGVMMIIISHRIRLWCYEFPVILLFLSLGFCRITIIIVNGIPGSSYSLIFTKYWRMKVEDLASIPAVVIIISVCCFHSTEAIFAPKGRSSPKQKTIGRHSRPFRECPNGTFRSE